MEVINSVWGNQKRSCDKQCLNWSGHIVRAHLAYIQNKLVLKKMCKYRLPDLDFSFQVVSILLNKIKKRKNMNQMQLRNLLLYYPELNLNNKMLNIVGMDICLYSIFGCLCH